MERLKRLTRRDFLKLLGGAAVGAAVPREEVLLGKERLSFQDGKYQTFPRQVIELNKTEVPVFYYIDIGTLGPDVDTIVGVDFPGNIPTSALVIYKPPVGKEVKETRVVFIKRADLETVQFNKALGGDRFDVYQISEHGGDEALDAMARKHARNTARRHQKVIYLGDLGLFEKEWGSGEKKLLQSIIRAQRPGKPELGIQEPNFVNQRIY